METRAVKRAGRPNLTENLPNRLKQLRLAQSMTQKQVAEYLGVTDNAICNAERRGRGLSRDNWFRLSVLFGVDPRYLEGWTPTETISSGN